MYTYTYTLSMLVWVDGSIKNEGDTLRCLSSLSPMKTHENWNRMTDVENSSRKKNFVEFYTDVYNDMCMYIYVYDIYICIYIHIYIYICLWLAVHFTIIVWI